MYHIKALVFSFLKHSAFTTAIVMTTIGANLHAADSSAVLKDDWNQTNYSTYMKARSAYEKGDFETAARLWGKLAENGFARAQIRLAVLYLKGEGVSRDYAKAIQWNQPPAEEGYPAAQNLMGVIFEYGFGVEKNHSEAIRWYTLAADQGYAKAKENLASLIAARSDSKGRDLLSASSILTGTYVSEITTNNSYFFPHPRHRRLEITLEQSGSQISGSTSSPESQLVGTLMGDTVKFNFWSAAVTKGYAIAGEWKIAEDGKTLNGSWQTSTGGSHGKWNLTRVE